MKTGITSSPPRAGKAKPISAATQAMLDEMAADAAGGLVSEDRLERVRDKVRELRDLEADNEALGLRIADNNAKIRLLKEKTLIEEFDAVGVNMLGVNAEGNHQPFNVELGEYFHARIPKENEVQAYAWLHKTKNEDLIQTEFKISFGRGEAKLAEKCRKMLDQKKVAYDEKESVPWNTFEAFLRAEFKKKPLTQKVMDMLGATTGRVAKVLKPKKEKK